MLVLEVNTQHIAFTREHIIELQGINTSNCIKHPNSMISFVLVDLRQIVLLVF